MRQRTPYGNSVFTFSVYRFLSEQDLKLLFSIQLSLFVHWNSITDNSDFSLLNFLSPNPYEYFG